MCLWTRYEERSFFGKRYGNVLGYASGKNVGKTRSNNIFKLSLFQYAIEATVRITGRKSDLIGWVWVKEIN